jgi:membrane protein required for colicin V production
MTIADWLIVAFLLITVLSAAKSGLIVEICSLAGLILGLLLASWNYRAVEPWLRQWIHSEALALTMAFILVFVVVMIVASIVGRVVRATVHTVGLGWADRIAGAAFGFVKGCAIVTIAMMLVAAFWPGAAWYRQSYLAPEFLSMASRFSLVTPSEMKERVRHGVVSLRGDQVVWLNSQQSFEGSMATFPGTHRDQERGSCEA